MSVWRAWLQNRIVHLIVKEETVLTVLVEILVVVAVVPPVDNPVDVSPVMVVIHAIAVKLAIPVNLVMNVRDVILVNLVIHAPVLVMYVMAVLVKNHINVCFAVCDPWFVARRPAPRSNRTYRAFSAHTKKIFMI